MNILVVHVLYTVVCVCRCVGQLIYTTLLERSHNLHFPFDLPTHYSIHVCVTIVSIICMCDYSVYVRMCVICAGAYYPKVE